MNIIRRPTPHFKKGRAGYQPSAVVIHLSTGSLRSCDNWFANPASGVSAHYCVGKRGEIHQYVDEKDTAFHAGTVVKPVARIILRHKAANPNYYTVGIEHEGQETDEWTPQMYAASARLIAAICGRWGIPIDSTHVIPHRHIRVDKSCPGYAVNLTKLIALALEISKGEESEGVASPVPAG